VKQWQEGTLVYLDNGGERVLQMCYFCAMNEHDHCLRQGDLLTGEPVDCRDCVVCNSTRSQP
jgi:hypothetical protein